MQADPAAGVLRSARRDRRSRPRRAGVLPRPMASGCPPVVQRRSGRQPGLEMPRRIVRSPARNAVVLPVPPESGSWTRRKSIRASSPGFSIPVRTQKDSSTETCFRCARGARAGRFLCLPCAESEPPCGRSLLPFRPSLSWPLLWRQREGRIGSTPARLGPGLESAPRVGRFRPRGAAHGPQQTLRFAPSSARQRRPPPRGPLEYVVFRLLGASRTIPTDTTLRVVHRPGLAVHRPDLRFDGSRVLVAGRQQTTSATIAPRAFANLGSRPANQPPPGHCR